MSCSLGTSVTSSYLTSTQNTTFQIGTRYAPTVASSSTVRIEYGSFTTSSLSVNAGTEAPTAVTFANAFSSVPNIVVAPASSYGSYIGVGTESQSTTGFICFVRVHATANSGTRAYTINYIAIGT